jgi:hypothetical protein
VSWLIEVEVGLDEAEVVEAKKFYSRAIAELVKLDVFDVDFIGEIRRGPVQFAVAVADEDMLKAACHGICAIRTAIHAAGGSTPGWPHMDELKEPEMTGPGQWVVHFNRAAQEPLQEEPVTA